MSAQHTPGPWKADGYHVRQNGMLGTRSIVDIAYTGPHHTPPDEYPKSCRLQDEANARLIAESPSLLAFSEWCVSQLQGDSGTGDTYWSEFPEYRDGLASISRATGKEGV